MNQNWTQERITAWGDQTFGPTHPAEIAKRMMVEVKELLDGFEVVGHMTPVLEMSPEQVQHLQQECADIEIMLRQVAEKLQVDLDSVVDYKMGVNVSRRWARSESGEMRHVKTFREESSGAEMELTKWYILSEDGACIFREGFDTQQEAVGWIALNHEGLAYPGFRVPEFVSPEKGWLGFDGSNNVVYGRDLYDFWHCEERKNGV